MLNKEVIEYIYRDPKNVDNYKVVPVDVTGKTAEGLSREWPVSFYGGYDEIRSHNNIPDDWKGNIVSVAADGERTDLYDDPRIFVEDLEGLQELKVIYDR